MKARHHCGRCRMSFRVGEAHGLEKSPYTRCSEPGCGQRFWFVEGSRGKSTVCGIDPKDIPELPRSAEDRPVPIPGVVSLNLPALDARNCAEGAGAFSGGGR